MRRLPITMMRKETDLMTETANDNQMSVDEWLALRKEAALKIDPETAEVHWQWGQILDPYGIKSDLTAEHDQAGRLYFARSPGSEIWVSFYDLPDEVCGALGRS